jgi:hypothetical protein
LVGDSVVIGFLGQLRLRVVRASSFAGRAHGLSLEGDRGRGFLRSGLVGNRRRRYLTEVQ